MCVLLRTQNPEDRKESYAIIQHGRCSHKEVRLSTCKSVLQTTSEVGNNSRYTEPSYVSHCIILISMDRWVGLEVERKTHSLF